MENRNGKRNLCFWQDLVGNRDVPASGIVSLVSENGHGVIVL